MKLGKDAARAVDMLQRMIADDAVNRPVAHGSEITENLIQYLTCLTCGIFADLDAETPFRIETGEHASGAATEIEHYLIRPRKVLKMTRASALGLVRPVLRTLFEIVRALLPDIKILSLHRTSFPPPHRRAVEKQPVGMIRLRQLLSQLLATRLAGFWIVFRRAGYLSH
ncbi:MAG: hypothetical protein AMXMBFR74_11900 [Parvibaculum sp.]